MRRVLHGTTGISGYFGEACTRGIGRQCLGEPRVFSRRALRCDERRDFRERINRMVTRVDEDGFGGEACKTKMKAKR